jgi:hypothetical protein
MATVSRNAVPLYRNPLFRPGLAALVEWLRDSEYSAHTTGRIFDYVAVNGTPTGCPELEPTDEAAATAVFCDGLDAVPYSSEAWSDPGVYLDVDSILEAANPLPTEPPDDWPGEAPDASPSRSAALGEVIRNGRALAPATWWSDGDFWVPPISGGSPSPDDWQAACEALRRPEPFTPSAEDLAEMHAHFDTIDAAEALYGYE